MLGKTSTMLHGTAKNVTGPYEWGKQPDTTLSPELNTAFDGPKSVVYTDSETNKTKYSLWIGGGVYLADALDGPFTKLAGFKYPGPNPATLYFQVAFYFTNSQCLTVWGDTQEL
jgi:hypothetical protein